MAAMTSGKNRQFFLFPFVFLGGRGWKKGRAWLVQLVRSLPSDHKVLGFIPGFAEIRIFVQPSFPPKPTQLSILPE